MNTNRSGASELHMSVAKFRAKLHEAYTKGQEAAGKPEQHRQDSIKEIVQGMNYR